jgi:hypothetical protein
MAKRSWNRFLALFCIAVAAACSPQSAVATNEATVQCAHVAPLRPRLRPL